MSSMGSCGVRDLVVAITGLASRICTRPVIGMWCSSMRDIVGTIQAESRTG